MFTEKKAESLILLLIYSSSLPSANFRVGVSTKCGIINSYRLRL